jgi:biotin-(acetyl-CoA carboxylase) ligase
MKPARASAAEFSAARSFHVNQRVRVTMHEEPERRGTVRGFARDGRCVRVQIDGLKTVTNFHPDFLTPERP